MTRIVEENERDPSELLPSIIRRMSSCPSCQTKFPICIVTGRPLMDLSSVWTCEMCHHKAYEQDVTMKQNCPLCHAPINV